MPLPFGPPNEDLARELRQVNRHAEAVLTALAETNVLPDDFPRHVLEDVCAALAGLEQGTAENCRPTLEYARNKIPEIRRAHFLIEGDERGIASSDAEAPRLYRELGLDRGLGVLLSSVTTALDEYRVQAQERFDDGVRAEETAAIRGEPETVVAEAEADEAIAAAEHARSELHDKHIDETEKGDILARRLQDGANLGYAARSQLRGKTIVRRWLEGIATAVHEVPGLIDKAGKALKVGADIAEPLAKWWSESGEAAIKLAIDQTRGLGNALEEVAERLRGRSRSAGGPKESSEQKTAAEPKSTDGVDGDRKDPEILRDRLADGTLGPEMVFIPAGRFLMGSQEDDKDADSVEKPQHEVVIESRFAIGRYPVTVGEYMAGVTAGGCPPPEWLEPGSQYHIETGSNDRYKKFGNALTGERYPIAGVSWQNARAYIRWLNGELGGGENGPYRLPSEAEWEYACRAGTETRYPWGNRWDRARANGESGGPGTPTEVGSYPANGFGLYDMNGNVWEWVEDGWANNYNAGRSQPPFRGEDSSICVLRGGSWSFNPRFLRSAVRGRGDPGSRDFDIGFRLSRTLAS